MFSDAASYVADAQFIADDDIWLLVCPACKESVRIGTIKLIGGEHLRSEMVHMAYACEGCGTYLTAVAPLYSPIQGEAT